jgi:hypothetical protein
MELLTYKNRKTHKEFNESGFVPYLSPICTKIICNCSKCSDYEKCDVYYKLEREEA